MTVDAELLADANASVSRGGAESVSAWVSQAMEERRLKEQRLAALDALIEEHEREHGVITEEEIEQQRQVDRDAAAAVRARRRRAG